VKPSSFDRDGPQRQHVHFLILPQTAAEIATANYDRCHGDQTNDDTVTVHCSTRRSHQEPGSPTALVCIATATRLVETNTKRSASRSPRAGLRSDFRQAKDSNGHITSSSTVLKGVRDERTGALTDFSMRSMQGCRSRPKSMKLHSMPSRWYSSCSRMNMVWLNSCCSFSLV